MWEYGAADHQSSRFDEAQNRIHCHINIAEYAAYYCITQVRSVDLVVLLGFVVDELVDPRQGDRVLSEFLENRPLREALNLVPFELTVLDRTPLTLLQRLDRESSYGRVGALS